MLDIRINGQSLDLYEDTILTFEQYNPLFQNEVGAEGFSYPIDLPASDTNRILFGFIENPQSTSTFEDYPCEIILNNEARKGTFSILKATQNRFICSIFLGYFDKNVLDLTLKDIDLGGVRAIPDMIAHANDLVTESADTADYVFFPVWNARFYGENGQPHFAQIINAYENNSFKTYTVETDVSDPQNPFDYILQTNTLIPFPYLVYVLKAIALAFGKTLEGTFIYHPEIKKLTIDNTYALDEIRIDAQSQLQGNLLAEKINLKNHVPNITIREFLNALIVKFNVAINITPNKLSINFKQDILNALEDSDYSDIVENNWTIEPFIKTDTEGVTFTDVIDENDTAVVDLAKRVLLDSEIKGTANYQSGFPATPQDGDIYFEVWQNQYFKANNNNYSIAPGIAVAGTYKVGRGDEKKESKISTLLMLKNITNVQEFPIIATYGLIPNTLLKGNSPVEEYGIGSDNDFPLRLLFYRGLQPNNSNGDTYPLGTNDIYNAISDTAGAIGSLSMQWGNTYGIYNTYHKNWLDTVNKAKAIELSLAITPLEWSRFDFFKPKRIINQSVIIEKITFTIAANGIRKAIARGLKR